MEWTEQQTAARDTFLEITQSQDVAAANQLLEASGWHLEKALSLFYEGGLPQPGASAAPAVPPRPSGIDNGAAPPRVSLLEELNRDIVTDAAPRIHARPQTYESNPRSILGLLFQPLRYFDKFFGTVVYFLSYLFPFLPRITGYYPADRMATRAITDPYDPKSIATRFIRTFEDSYGENDLPFYEGGYLQALEAAKRDLKYLVTVVTSPLHENAKKFADLLKDAKCIELLKRDDIILWGGSVAESEAYQLANNLKITEFPFTALIGPSPKTPQSNTVIMELLVRIPGVASSSQNLVNTIEQHIDQHSPKIMALRLDRERANVDRDIRREQDSAYERSLAADRAREVTRQRERNEAAAEEVRRAQLLAAEEQYSSNLQAWKQWRASQFKARGEDFEGPASRVMIRLPSGERLVAKFAADDTVSSIYEYVLCHGTEITTEVLRAPEGFIPKYSFELVSPMPRQVLIRDDTPIKNSPNVWPNGSLLVDELDDE